MKTALLESAMPGGKPGTAGEISAGGASNYGNFSTPLELSQALPIIRHQVVNTRHATPPADEAEEMIKGYAAVVNHLISLASEGLELALTDAQWIRFFTLRLALYRLILGGD